LPMGIARCQLALGHYQEAVAAFEHAVNDDGDGIYAVEDARSRQRLRRPRPVRWRRAARDHRPAPGRAQALGPQQHSLASSAAPPRSRAGGVPRSALCVPRSGGGRGRQAGTRTAASRSGANCACAAPRQPVRSMERRRQWWACGCAAS
jgi:hypothetical protein